MNDEFAREPIPQPGEHLHINRAHGFQIIQPVGWRVADAAEVRATYDSRNWRRAEHAPEIPIESMTLPALTLTVGPPDDPLPGDTVLIEVCREPDINWSPLDQVATAVELAREWVHFDAQILEAPTPCVSQGLPAARATLRYTALPVAGGPALCRAHFIVHRRGSDLISLAVASVIDGGLSAPDKTLERLLGSFRIFHRAGGPEASVGQGHAAL